MKKSYFLVTGLTACITGITGLVFLFIGKQDMFLISIALTGVLASIFLVLDPDNKNQARKATPLTILICIGIAIMLIMSMSSCRTGYGCHGNESWGRMVYRINRP